MKQAADFEFEALKWITGTLYTEKRDAWLASKPDARAWLLLREQDQDWRTSVTATILLGWLDHRSAYEDLLRSLDDPERWKKVQKTVMGFNAIWDGYGARVRNDAEFGKLVFPLCLEAVLKRHREWGYPKTRTFFEMLRQMGNPRSIEPLFWFLQNVAQDKDERDLAAFALRLFPEEPLRSRIAKLRTDQKAVMEALESELENWHLSPKYGDDGGDAR